MGRTLFGRRKTPTLPNFSGPTAAEISTGIVHKGEYIASITDGPYSWHRSMQTHHNGMIATLDALRQSVDDQLAELEKTKVKVSKVKCVCCGGIEIQNSRCVWCRNPR